MVGVLEELEKGSPGRRIALVVSGDPGFYSLAKKVIGRFGRDSVEVIPGILSLQILSARLGRSWVNVPRCQYALHDRSHRRVPESQDPVCAGKGGKRRRRIGFGIGNDAKRRTLDRDRKSVV